MLRRLGSRALLVGLVIGLAAGGTFAWAAIPATSTGNIVACYPTSGTSKGALRVVDYQAGQRCISGEAQLTWPTRGFRWRGPWFGSVAYGVNDVVRYNGSAYIAKLANTNVAPTNTTNWALMVSVGSTGPTGVAGPTGPQGSTGVNGVSGWQWIANGPITLHPDDRGDFSVTCPTGTQVLGGGWQANEEAVRVTQSYPDPATRSWVVTVHDIASVGTQTLYVQATCAAV